MHLCCPISRSLAVELYASELTTLSCFLSTRILVFNITLILQYGPQWSDTASIIMSTLSFVAYCPIVPRFILDLRELHDRDLRGRWQRIDTAFSARSQPISEQDVAVSAISFAEASSAEGPSIEGCVDDLEVVRLRVVGYSDGVHQV